MDSRKNLAVLNHLAHTDGSDVPSDGLEELVVRCFSDDDDQPPRDDKRHFVRPLESESETSFVPTQLCVTKRDLE